MKFLFSSIGKKIQVAVTGILLSLFLLFHLMNNLVLFTGADNFNQMVLFLEGIKPLIRIMEFGLLVVILTHVINAIYLTISNKKAATTRYSVDASATSSLNAGETYYDVLLRNELGYLGHTPTAVFYIIAILFIASHLKHGIESSLKTFGLTNKSKWSILYLSSVLFWGIIPLGFIVVVLSIQFGIIS